MPKKNHTNIRVNIDRHAASQTLTNEPRVKTISRYPCRTPKRPSTTGEKNADQQKGAHECRAYLPAKKERDKYGDAHQRLDAEFGSGNKQTPTHCTISIELPG